MAYPLAKRDSPTRLFCLFGSSNHREKVADLWTGVRCTIMIRLGGTHPSRIPVSIQVAIAIINMVSDGDPPPISFPVPLSRAEMELFRWNLCLRAMQGPLGEMTKVGEGQGDRPGAWGPWAMLG